MQVLKKDISKQFLRFCLIGLECTVLNYLIFLVFLYYLSVNYIISAASGFISGTVLGFIFNKLYTFGSKESSAKAIPKYFLVYLFSLVFTIFAIKFLVEFLIINVLIANVIVIGITTLINFFGTKILVFKNKRW